MDPLKTAVIVLGAAGKMGFKVTEQVRNDPRCSLAGALDIKTSGKAGLLRALEAALGTADVAIDFTDPAAAVAHAALCARAKKPLVIGTTGFNARQLNRIRKASGTAPVFLSPNMSPAVNLAIAVARLMAARLPDFDVRISESHHKFKKDAPSGTALNFKARIGEVYKGPVPITSVRAGAIVGEHTVLYAGPHELLELTHSAQSREVFAEGALRAALWLKDKRPGLYDYSDLLGLKNI